MSMPGHFSHTRSHGKILVWLMLALLPVAFAAGFLLQNDLLSGKQQQIEQLETQATDYLFQMQQLEAELARLDRSRQVDVEAVRMAQLTISDLQQQLADQDQQLQFYQAVLAPEARKSGLRLVDLDLEKGIQANRFHYRLLMIQQRRNDKLISGNVRLILQGHKDGKPAKLTLNQLGAKSATRDFRFRYFSELTGELVVPQGFRPVSILVSGQVTRPKRSNFQKKYDWPSFDQVLTSSQIDQPEIEQDVP